jgi:hypothetical protein
MIPSLSRKVARKKMEVFNQQSALKSFLNRDRNNEIEFSLAGLASLSASKFYLSNGMLSFIEKQQLKPGTRPRIDIFPIWIESQQSMTSPCGDASAVLFFSPRSIYHKWRQSSHFPVHTNFSSIGSEQQWNLIVLDTRQQVLIDGMYAVGQWSFATEHTCPFHKCQFLSTTTKRKKRQQLKLYPCQMCIRALKYWSRWFTSVFNMLIQDRNLTRKSFHFPLLEVRATTSDMDKIIVVSLPPQPEKAQIVPIRRAASVSEHSSSLEKPITTHLLINQYIEKISSEIVESVIKSHKYLWMQSAWLMTEMLRLTTDDVPLQLPMQDIYIELEQTYQLHGQEVAAFSLLRTNHLAWKLSAINGVGQTVWVALYEQNIWKLPQRYTCPNQQCTQEETPQGTVYQLCNQCQERITHYTS